MCYAIEKTFGLGWIETLYGTHENTVTASTWPVNFQIIAKRSFNLLLLADPFSNIGTSKEIECWHVLGEGEQEAAFANRRGILSKGAGGA